MRAADPRAAARALAFGRVKVCGLTDAHDVVTAAAVGATYAGLVMVPHTPRVVTTGRAERLAATAAQRHLPLVAVFRDEALPKLVDAARALGLRSEEHTSELQSLMRISSAVFCLK